MTVNSKFSAAFHGTFVLTFARFQCLPHPTTIRVTPGPRAAYAPHIADDPKSENSAKKRVSS